MLSAKLNPSLKKQTIRLVGLSLNVQGWIQKELNPLTISGCSVILGRSVLMSCPSPRRVCSWVGDNTLVEALDLMGPTVMTSEDCECEGTMVPLLG